MFDGSIVRRLIDKGVIVPDPSSVSASENLRIDLIEPGSVLMPGVRIAGPDLAIGEGSVIGSEGPATVQNCHIGRHVKLGSGYFDGAVFLDGSSMGGGAHVRAGSLIEEQASGAHTVGLKQTILLPFVTLGSLINFCDILMAGGTSRRDHSEVGSSYIHFNYTPHQDKATASLAGDAVNGVLLDQPPVFLGGQGGLVGPARIAYGTVVAAGQVLRRDVTQAGLLVTGSPPSPGERPYDVRVYGRISRVVGNGFAYIGQVYALKEWYRKVRIPLAASDPLLTAVYRGALAALDVVLAERVKRLGELAAKFESSADLLEQRGNARSAELATEQRAFAAAWPDLSYELEEKLKQEHRHRAADAFATRIRPLDPGASYVEWVRGLDDEGRGLVRDWLGDAAAEIESLGKNG